MLKTIAAIIIATTSILSVGCTTTELKQPTDVNNVNDALFLLEDCFYSSRSTDKRLLNSVRYFHQQTSRNQQLNFEFVKNELHYCQTGEDLF